MGDEQRIAIEIDPERIRRDTYDFVRVASETGAEGPGSLFFADLLRREGFEPEIDLVEPDRPNVYARMPGTKPGAPTLLFNGHTDTIPIGKSLPPALDGDWVVGRGAEDMKGGLVAMVHAAAAVKRAGIVLGGDVWLTGVIDHETPRGQKTGPRRLIEHLRGGRIRADAVLIVEGPHAIWSASLGSTIFHVDIESPRGIVHTIHVPFRENPACWLGSLLKGLEAMELEFQEAEPHPLCGHERINVGQVRGGDYPNRLPTPVTVTGTWRWKPGETHAGVKRRLDELCRSLSSASGLRFSARFEGNREPFETPDSHPLIRAIRASTDAPRIGMALVGDGNLYANEGGTPVAYFGPEYKTAHSDDERVSVARLTECARVYAETMIRFCGGG